ncbi:Scarecrow-like protein 23 [Apostasia shenzhenica]|uniref:Scarecrow-like protein 23 n=1 Tax=Apostasia shenzhenica TaxID=1088818 RepID=A0A2I0APA7_9ASPA|nr:Scarecrow-like protein 23 [Apostasia shenzhenica]
MQQTEVSGDLPSLSLSLGGRGTSSYHADPSLKHRKRKREQYDRRSRAKHLLRARNCMMRRCSNEFDGKGHLLIRLILLCAASVHRRDLRTAAESLMNLYRRASLTGEPIERVAAYFADGLFARLLLPSSPLQATIAANPSPEEELAAFAGFYYASPCYQFAHFTANQAIMDAYEEAESFNGGNLHVVDLDVSHGFQWPSLMQSLSDRATTTNKPISLSITGFGRSLHELRQTAARLRSFAGGCSNLSFDFQGKIIRPSHSGPLAVLREKKNATVVVNNLVFYLQTLKSTAEISSTLRAIREVNPNLVILVEREDRRPEPEEHLTENRLDGEEEGGGGGGFLPRFMESLQYFAAMFDSLNGCLPRESLERVRIEKNHLGREIREALLMGDRPGRRTREMMMERRWFEGVRMSWRAVSQAKLLVKMKSQGSAMEHLRGGARFSVWEEDDGRALSLGWQGRRLLTVTAWRCSP